jgi:hypothetical protein
MHTLGEVPDSFLKSFIPLGKNIWRCFQKLGWEYWIKQSDLIKNGDLVFNLLKERLNEAILTAKEVIEGKVLKPWRIISYTLFPPICPIRSDAQQGTMKLIFGESVDTTYTVIDDIAMETMYLLNCHLEDGLPVDWWLVKPTDELLDRRHLKYGFKLRDLQKHIKDLSKASFRMVDILRDVRNERAPFWSTSAYHVAAVYLSGAINAMLELSNYSTYCTLFDGISAKRVYNLPETWYDFIPNPPFLQTLLLTGRRSFSKRWASWLGNKLYLSYVEPVILEWLKSQVPELFEIGLVEQWKEGLPYPKQSLISSLVLLDNFKATGSYYVKNSDPKITYQDLGITLEEAFDGFYLRVDNETEPGEKVDSTAIISRGLGRKTKIYQD